MNRTVSFENELVPLNGRITPGGSDSNNTDEVYGAVSLTARIHLQYTCLMQVSGLLLASPVKTKLLRPRAVGDMEFLPANNTN